MKFVITLAWPKRAFRNDERVESTDLLEAPSADVAYARAVAKWPDHDVLAVTTAARWAFEPETAKTLSAPHARPAA